ncbi:S4 domain-containing protein YaaA [Streptococcaceae bacterium ESL0729]|nr:S4 domain-containing protein YaaA [Streptococcaceae bacterium ESL0729]
MNYILFDEFITLGKLLKEIDMISSGGAAKAFLAENTIIMNGEFENRRGRKLRVGDRLEFPDFNLVIEISAPSEEERAEFLEEKEEKERVKEIVARLNKENKKTTKKPAKPRFPGVK